MSDEVGALAERLVRDGEKTEAFFRSLDPEQWSRQVYTTGSRWSVQHVLAHFVSAEHSFHLLITDVAEGGPGAPRDLDIDEFNETEVPAYRNWEWADLLKAYAGARAKSAQLTRALNPDDLDRVGFHPWFGEVSLRSMLKLIYRHNMIHLRDVRKAIVGDAPVPHREIEPPAQTGAK